MHHWLTNWLGYCEKNQSDEFYGKFQVISLMKVHLVEHLEILMVYLHLAAKLGKKSVIIAVLQILSSWYVQPVLQQITGRWNVWRSAAWR